MKILFLYQIIEDNIINIILRTAITGKANILISCAPLPGQTPCVWQAGKISRMIIPFLRLHPLPD